MAADLGLAPKKKMVQMPQRTGPMDTTPVPPGPQANGSTLMPMRNAPMRVPTGGPMGYHSPFDPPQGPVFPVPQQANVPTGPAAIAAHTAASVPGVPGPQLPPIPPTAPAQYASQVQQHGLIDNRGAELFQRNTGYMPNRTVGGAYGPPQGPLPFEQKQPIDLGNALFQGAQPGMVAGKPAWVGGPEAAPFPSQRSTAISGRTTATDEAKALFDARRGGVDARRNAYESRTAAAATERSTNRKAREMAKGDARRVRMGNLTFEERLAASDPQAAAQGKLAQSQLGANTELRKAQMAHQANVLAAQERMNTENNKTRKEVAGLGLTAKGVDPATGKPVDARTDAEKIEGADKIDLSGKTKEERKLLVKDLPPETQQRLLEEAAQNDLGFFDQPAGGIFSHPEAVTRGDAVKNTIRDIFASPELRAKNAKNPPKPYNRPKRGSLIPYPPFIQVF